MNTRFSGNGECLVSAPLPGQAAQQWVNRLTTISRNLMELSEAESTKIIRARTKDSVNGYRGVTKEKAARVVDMLDQLLHQYALLAHVVDEAADLAKKNGIFRNYDARINDLLNGPSVVVTQEQVALHERGLLDDEQRVIRATPAEVLARMEQSFAEARDAISAIAAAIAGVRPRFAALRDEISRLDDWAKSLGVANTTTSPDLSQALSDVERDPLGGAAEIERLEDAIARRRDELQAIDADHKAILASIERGRTALTELQDTIKRSTAAFAEARETIVDPEELAPPDGDNSVESLAEWLSTLEQNVAGGRFAAVKVGLVKWERAYDDRLSAARTSYDRNRALLDERDELRGRFKALRAKADALRSRGVVFGEAVESASRQAQSVLDAIPFDMRAGRRLVGIFEAAVSAASKSS
jgi:chromosome segregation ATPase